jgi:hypothetical protein
LDWIIKARKKANTKSNILSAWKKAGLVPFNPDLVLGQLPTVKKYISEPQTSPIETSTIPAEPSSQITVLVTGSSSRPVTPADQVTVINGTMIIRFPVRNSLVIQEIIDKLSTQTPSLPTYRATVKAFINYTTAEALVRDLQIKKLQKAAANKKKRSKKTVRLSVVCPETWEIIQEEQREKIRARDEANKAKRKTAANKANGKGKGKTNGKSKGKGKGKNKGKNNDQLTAETSEEAVNSLFRDINDKDDEGVEAQLAAELETITLNEATTTTRSGRIRRAPVRYRNS